MYKGNFFKKKIRTHSVFPLENENDNLFRSVDALEKKLQRMILSCRRGLRRHKLSWYAQVRFKMGDT